MSVKNALRALARKMLGRSIEVIDLEVKFYKDANIYGTHGYIRASHHEHNLKDSHVRFVFLGMSEPPVLTPRIIDYIWEEARAQGFIPHHFISYGRVLMVDSGVKGNDLVSEARRQAEIKAANIVNGVDRRVDNVAALRS